MTVTLYAYQYSVYSWVARLVLQEKSVAYNYVEVNPFAPDTPAEYLLRNPFRRVPTLVHDEFVLYETGAITRYIDDVFAGDALRPADRRSLARMAQIISIIDAYGYWPMVRQVYSNRIFRPRVGLPVNEDDVRIGIRSAERTVAALEELAHPHGYLIDTSFARGPASGSDDRIFRRHRRGTHGADETQEIIGLVVVDTNPAGLCRDKA